MGSAVMYAQRRDVEHHVIERLNIRSRPPLSAHVRPESICQCPSPSANVRCAVISNLATFWLQTCEQLLPSRLLSAKRKPAQL